MPVSTFDVRQFARTAAGCHRDQLELTRFDEQPLTPESLRCLCYLRDLERATMRYLRHVLVTPTHKNARITAFLTTWAYEKYWIADALDAILEHHRYQLPVPHQRGSRRAAGRQRVRDRFGPILRSLIDNAIGEGVIAVHMTTGCVDEWFTRAAYQRVTDLDQHPELARVVGTIHDIKARHLEFFEAEARDRLGRSRRWQRLTRIRLRRSRWLVSVVDRPSEDSFFFGRVFAGVPALVTDLDRRVQALPGLAKLTLIRANVAAATR